MLISSFFVNWFQIDFTYFRLNLGWFALVYCGLLIYQAVMTGRAAAFSDRELHDWGETLTDVTPLIVDRLTSGAKAQAVCDELEKSKGIPPLITMKYIVALANYLAASAGSNIKSLDKTEDKQ